MTRMQAAFELPMDLERAWPVELFPEDPWAGDERLDDPAAHAAHLDGARSPALSPAEHAAWDARFRAAYADVLDGRAPWGAEAEAAAALQVDGPLRHEDRLHKRAEGPVSDEVIAHFCEDWVPDVGLFAAERVLGPWAMSATRGQKIVATAALCMSPLLPPAIRPVTRASRSEPRAPAEVRGPLVAVLRAPVALWAVEGASVRPLIPLAPQFLPDGPIADLPQGVPAFVGRVVQLQAGGAFVRTALGLPVCPDPAVLMRRLRLELLRLRRHGRGLSWEDLLRDRGELVLRTCCEWAWVHARAAGAPRAAAG